MHCTQYRSWLEQFHAVFVFLQRPIPILGSGHDLHSPNYQPSFYKSQKYSCQLYILLSVKFHCHFKYSTSLFLSFLGLRLGSMVSKPQIGAMVLTVPQTTWPLVSYSCFPIVWSKDHKFQGSRIANYAVLNCMRWSVFYLYPFFSKQSTHGWSSP